MSSECLLLLLFFFLSTEGAVDEALPTKIDEVIGNSTMRFHVREFRSTTEVRRGSDDPAAAS